MNITMPKVDILQVLISAAAIFGIVLVWYDFNVKVFERTNDFLNATQYETDEEMEIRKESKERRIPEEMKRLEEKKRIEEEEAVGKND